MIYEAAVLLMRGICELSPKQATGCQIRVEKLVSPSPTLHSSHRRAGAKTISNGCIKIVSKCCTVIAVGSKRCVECFGHRGEVQTDCV